MTLLSLREDWLGWRDVAFNLSVATLLLGAAVTLARQVWRSFGWLGAAFAVFPSAVFGLVSGLRALLFIGSEPAAAVETLLQQAWQDHRRSNRSLCIAVVDIDHFKRINDGHGHAAGDRALALMGEVLRQQARRRH